MEQARRRRAAGRAGENAAVRYLRRRGYKILRRNFRARHGGEVDIVCRDDRTLVFCEVKSRRSQRFGGPRGAVDRAKEELLWRGAREWLRKLGNPAISFRFDVVEVLLDDSLKTLDIRHHIDPGDARDRFRYSPQCPNPLPPQRRPRRSR